MYAFYFTGITDFQDMFTTLLSSLKSGKKCWVCLFDCLIEKRQFYFYRKEELVDFIKSVCKKNNIPIPEINFYGLEDQKIFSRDYDKNNPTTVFLQSTWHRSPAWYPKCSAKKLIQYAWGQDSFHRINQAKYRPDLIVLRRKEDENFYKNCGIDSVFFGDLKLESLHFEKELQTLKVPDGVVSCYISESFVSKTGKREQISNLDNSEYGKKIDQILSCLRRKNIFTIWKKREKGFPNKKWGSPLEFASCTPDLTIEKDLNFPSAVIAGPAVANFCIFAGWSSSYYMAKSVNENVLLLDVTKNIEKQITDFISKINLQAAKKKPTTNASLALLNKISSEHY